MKFETVSNKPDTEVKAIIHESGCLIVQTGNGCVAFDSDSATFHPNRDLDFWHGLATEKFYEGDKITITF